MTFEILSIFGQWLASVKDYAELKFLSLSETCNDENIISLMQKLGVDQLIDLFQYFEG
ncbi:hypothetical protein ACFL17_05445 [Pseudomonadota bacterium]